MCRDGSPSLFGISLMPAGSSADRMIHSSSDCEPDEGRSTERGQRLAIPLRYSDLPGKLSFFSFLGVERGGSEQSPLEIPSQRSEASRETQSWEKASRHQRDAPARVRAKEYGEEISAALQTGDRESCPHFAFWQDGAPTPSQRGIEQVDEPFGGKNPLSSIQPSCFAGLEGLLPAPGVLNRCGYTGFQPQLYLIAAVNPLHKSPCPVHFDATGGS